MSDLWTEDGTGSATPFPQADPPGSGGHRRGRALSRRDRLSPRLCRRAGLPAPSRQRVRTDSTGRRRYLDVAWDQFRLVVEIDGMFHTELARWMDDSLRGNEITLGDRVLLRFPALLLRTDPERVLAQVRQALINAGWRPAGVELAGLLTFRSSRCVRSGPRRYPHGCSDTTTARVVVSEVGRRRYPHASGDAAGVARAGEGGVRASRRRRSRCRGCSRPRSGLHAPHVRVWPAGHSGSTRSTSREAGGRRARGPGRRPCGGARRRSRRPVVLLDVRRAVEVGVARHQPAGPRVVREAQRTGWVTENTHRPPGRSTRATSRITAAESATNGSAPYAEQARSKLPSANGSRRGVGLHERYGEPGGAPIRRPRPQHRRRQVERRPASAPCGRQPPRALGRAAADLEHPAAARRRRAGRRRPRPGPPGPRRSAASPRNVAVLAR